MQDDQQEPLIGDYTGTFGGMLSLAWRTTILTLMTLGIYRFWARTRIRRYVWSATAPGGDPFEYTGTGLEKLLGFLISVVVLAVILGLTQIALFFMGMSMFSGNQGPMAEAMQIMFFQLSLLILLPLIYFARYRSRRYMLSRTRWRGLRFGMDNGGIDYALRAIGHTFLTSITLGILLPRQTYYLQKFMIERTWYGDKKFELGGDWKMLFPAMINFLVAIMLMISGAIAMTMHPLAVIWFFVGYMWFFVALVSYRVHTYAILTGKVTLGSNIFFKAVPSAVSVVGRLILGGIVLSILIGVLWGLFFGGAAMVGANISLDPDSGLPSTGVVVGFTFAVMATIALSSALSKALIVQPIIRHFVDNTALMNPQNLAYVRQREGDDIVDADGFADALDVGAAI